MQAAGAIGLLGFAFWQMGFIRTTAIATKNAAEAAKNNAIAAERAARATEEISEKTEKNLRTLERAWLLVRLDRPLDFVENVGTRIRYSILNTGRTLARFKHSEAFITTSEGFPDLPQLEIDRSRYDVTKCVIFPDTPMEQRGENRNVLAPETIQRIKAGSVNIIVRGFAVYDDVFGVRHVTQFCQVWSPTWNDGRGGFVLPREPRPGYENDAD